MKLNLFGSLLLMFAFAGRSSGDIVLTAIETGGDVVISGGGAANLDGLNLLTNGVGFGAIVPQDGTLLTPVGFVVVDFYGSTSGPVSFGTGTYVNPTSGFGDALGVESNSLYVPTGYVSGTNLSTTMVFANQTFASIGLTPGTYVWTWGSGANADSFTLQIGAIPEPATLGVFSLGLVGLICLGRRRRHTA